MFFSGEMPPVLSTHTNVCNPPHCLRVDFFLWPQFNCRLSGKQQGAFYLLFFFENKTNRYWQGHVIVKSGGTVQCTGKFRGIHFFLFELILILFWNKKVFIVHKTKVFSCKVFMVLWTVYTEKAKKAKEGNLGIGPDPQKARDPDLRAVV